YVKITLNENEFVIEDNCGGFSLKTAKEYAFRFGRPEGKKFVNHSIGRFGVGMKRALFKFGKQFTVETKHKKDRFKVSVNVDNWLSSPDDWDFNYELLQKKESEISTDGTIIRVSKLYENVKNDFESNTFLIDLKKEMQLALYFNIIKGLNISINNSLIERKDISFLQSPDLNPAFKEVIFGEGDTKVSVKIICGIGTPSPANAGWYIFCNERLVLEADKSYNT